MMQFKYKITQASLLLCIGIKGYFITQIQTVSADMWSKTKQCIYLNFEPVKSLSYLSKISNLSANFAQSHDLTTKYRPDCFEYNIHILTSSLHL